MLITAGEMIADFAGMTTGAYIRHFILSPRELNNSKYTAFDRWVDSSVRGSCFPSNIARFITVELERVLDQVYGGLVPAAGCVVVISC